MLAAAAPSLVREVIDELASPCFVVEQDWTGELHFLAANAAFATACGRDVTELAARSPVEVMAPAVAQRLARVAAERIETRTPGIVAPEAGEAGCLLVPLRRRAGQAGRLLGLLIPCNGQLDDGAAALVDLLSGPQLLADAAGRLLSLNAAARGLLEVDGRMPATLAEMLPALPVPAERAALATTMHRADGSLLPVELTVMAAPQRRWLLSLRELGQAAGDGLDRPGLQAHELAMILDAQSELVARFLPDTTLLYVNAAGARLLGCGREELLGQRFISFMLPEERGPLLERLAALSPRAPASRSEHRALAADGRTLWLEWTSRAIFDERERLVEFQLVGRDVTERRQAQLRLKESERRYRQLVSELPDAFLVVQDGLCVFANPAATRLLGGADRQLEGLPVERLVAEEDAGRLEALLASLLRGTDERLHVELRVRALDGRLVDAEIMASCCELDGCRSVQMTARDVTARRAEQATMAHLAMHDPLTGLANRLRFQDELRRACARAARERRRAALLCLDLDGFKEVNDRHGHAVGDELLVEVGRRLGAVVRKGDLAARLGGDEFAVVVPVLADAGQAERLASRLVAAMGEPVRLDGQEFRLGVSIGIGLFPDHGATEQDLFARADAALYRAKRAGKGGWRIAGPPGASAADPG